MAVHTGKRPADLPDDMNPADESVFWVSWEEALNGYSMDTSSWILPDGFTELSTVFNVVSDPDENGETYPNSNGIQISTSLENGTYYIGNQITYTNTNFNPSITVTLQRGFNLTIDNV